MVLRTVFLEGKKECELLQGCGCSKSTISLIKRGLDEELKQLGFRMEADAMAFLGSIFEEEIEATLSTMSRAPHP
jgi:hypothetical protein